MPTYEAGRAFVQISPSMRNFHRDVRAEVAKIRGVTVPVTAEVDTSRVRPALQAATRNTPKATIETDADTTKARASIARLGLSKPTVTLNTEADTTKARADIDQLGRDTPNVTVKADADTARASANLSALRSQARRVDGERVNISVNANDVSRAITLTGLLTAGLTAVAAAGAPAAAAIAALGPMAGVAAQGIGALLTGLSGVGDAVKALQQEELKAAAGTAVTAAQRTNSAQTIAAAHRAVEQAVIQANRAEITGAQQVQDSLRGVRAAEEDYTRAKVDARRAQEDLTRARREAREEIEDLGRSLRGAALDEREAELRLAEAREALTKGRAEGVQGRDLQRLELDAERAALALENATDRHGDLREESAKAARVGVEGSDRVVAAQERARSSAEQVRAAETRLGEVREQVDRARQQALWAQQDAERAVEESQIRLNSAYADAGNMGATSANKVAEAFAELSPEAQRFARFLSGQVIPGLQGVRAEVQRTLLPRLETSLRNLGTLAPVVSAGLADTGEVIGNLAIRGSEMMSSGPWRTDFASIMSSNNRILEDFGTAGLNTADAMRHITVAAGPMTERLADAAVRGSEMTAQWLATKRASGELDEFFLVMGDRLARLADFALQVATGLIQLADALAPVGDVVLSVVGGLVEFLGWLSQVNPELVQIIATGLIVGSTLTTLGKLFAGLGASTALAVAGWQKLGGVIAAFGPAAVQTRIAQVTGLVDAQGVATDRAATKTGRFLTTVSRVGAALPVVGAALAGGALAWDAIVVSSGEAADALNKGGVEAEKARDRIDALEQGTTGFLGVLRPFITTQEEATAAAKEQRDALGPLARAQLDAERAANDHQLVLRDFSEFSPEAQASARRLAEAQNELERQQGRAASATKDHTDRILEQQGVMQGALSSDLAYREALERVNAELRELAGVSQLSTEQSLQLEGSIIRAAEAAQRRALDNYADKTSVEAVEASNKAYNATLLDLITKAGTQAPAALQAYIGKLSDAELKAIGARIETDHLGNRVAVLPGGKHINITTSAPVAEQQVKSLHRAIDELPKNSSVRVVLEPLVKASTGEYRQPPPNFPGMIPGGYAAGGPVRGPGSRTSDSILVRLSDDEHVWTAAEVAGAGGHDRVERLRELAATGRLPAFAAGGPVAGGVTRRPFLTTAPVVGAAVSITDPTAAAKAFAKVSDVITGRFTPALEAAQQAAGVDTVAALKALLGQVPVLTKATADSGLSIRDTWARNTASVTTAQQQQTGQYQRLGTNLAASAAAMTRSVGDMQARHNASWADMRARSGAEAATITGPVFGNLHAGLAAIRDVSARTADWWGGQMARLRPLTGDPVRWSLQHPLNRGLVPAWNAINAFFALNRPMGPVPIGFAAGGPITGGIPGKDSVPILAMEDEFIVRREIAKPFRPFLEAFNSGQPEALQAAGGRRARFAAGGPVEKGLNFARAQHGKPYIWGGVGPRGYDCSGFISAIANVLMGRNPHQRIGTTGSAPWAGWSRGLNSAFGVGFFKGNPGHMAGTLQGANVEAGGSPSMTKFVQNAAGARSGQFAGHMSLPQVGGQFVGGGDGGIDVGAYVREKMGPALRMVADLARFFGPGNAAVAAQALARQSIDGAISWATSNVAGSGVAGSGPVREQVQAVARRFGWGSGPQWAAEDRLIQKESSWNPLAQNPRSTAFGLYQFLDSTWATVGGRKTSNPGLQAEYGNRYIKARYGDPARALAFHNRNNWYDQGGWLPPGWSTVYNGTGRRERAAVFNDEQWRDLSMAARGGDGPLIGSLTQHITPGASADEIIGSAMFEARRARTRGRYR